MESASSGYSTAISSADTASEGTAWSFEPALSASYQGFSISFWGNIDMREKATPCFVPDRPGRKSFNETDLTSSYSRNLGRFGLTAGFIYYGTKYTAETQELYAGASWMSLENPLLRSTGISRVSRNLFPFFRRPFAALKKMDNTGPGRFRSLLFGIG